MEILNAYFANIIFSKVEQKEHFTVYAASISSSFGDGKKTYALAFVPIHMAILSKAYLKDLHWQNFQTRMLTNGWKLQAQRWDMRQLKGVPTPMFNVVDRSDVRTKYRCETEPLEMVLLHSPKKKGIYQYGNRINFLAALATFNCVLNFIEGHQMQATQPMFALKPATTVGGTGNYAPATGPSSIPIASLATHAPEGRAAPYRPVDLSSDTSYIPRNEGTRYAANGANATGYEFNSTIVSGGTGYRSLALNLSPTSPAVATSSEHFNEPETNEEIDAAFELI